MDTCNLYLPVVRTLKITKIIDFNQADYMWYFVCYYFFGGQFRLVDYFDSEIVRSLSAYFGKTRSEIGYLHTKFAMCCTLYYLRHGFDLYLPLDVTVLIWKLEYKMPITQTCLCNMQRFLRCKYQLEKVEIFLFVLKTLS